MTNEELAKWIAEKLPEGHPFLYERGWIEMALKETDYAQFGSIISYGQQQLTSGLMLDAMHAAGCEFELKSPDSDGRYMIWVVLPDRMNYNPPAFGDSRYAAIRAACEAVAGEVTAK